MKRLRWNGNIVAQQEAEASQELLPVRRRKSRSHKDRQTSRRRDRRAYFRRHYNQYLESARWRRKRLRALEHYGRKCETCGSTSNLLVHHKTYERLGEERMSDLEVLCVECHRNCHEGMRGIVMDAMTKEYLDVLR